MRVSLARSCRRQPFEAAPLAQATTARLNTDRGNRGLSTAGLTGCCRCRVTALAGRCRAAGALAALLGGLVLWPAAARALDLVRDGAGRATIVVPDQALPVVRAAAEELQDHVRRATGVVLPIVPEAQRPAAGPVVLLGATAAANAAEITVGPETPNQFVIALNDDALFLVGDDSDGEPFWIQHGNRVRVGTLFAVYRFIEKQLAVRWLWPGDVGTVVPNASTISIASWPRETGKPPFVHARWRDGGAYMAGPQGWAVAANRSRFLQEQGKWLRRHRFAMGVNMDMAHSFTNWWERFDKDHPEYFNLLPDGTRRPDPNYHGGQPSLISMSVSEPGVARQKVADWAASRTPQAPYVDASENDTPGLCVCEPCLAWDEPDPTATVPFDQRLTVARTRFAAGDKTWHEALGSLSDRYARFYLAVQKQAETVDPAAVVMGYSYANYVQPPRQARLNDRIIIGIVPALMFPWTAEKRQGFLAQWDGWAAAGARVFLRPNYMLDGHNLPIFFARQLGADFGYAAAHGLVGTDFDSLTGQYSTQSPNLYMLARLHDEPTLTADAVLAEFYAAFGPAAASVRGYFAHWEQVSGAVTDALCQEADLHWSYFYQNADRIFTPAVMAQGRALLEQAGVAARDDADAAARVAYLEKGLRNAELTLAVQQAVRRYRDTGDVDGYGTALTALDAFRAQIEGELVANMAYLAWAEGRHWDRSLLRLLATPGTRLPDPWLFAWDPQDQGLAGRWFAPDLDTNAWHQIGTSSAWEEQPVGQQWRAEHGGAGYDGIAWYRTTFDLAAGDAATQVRLLFGAVDEACTVWLNGRQLLARPYPFQGNPDSWRDAFELDVTEAVRRDGPNALVLRVEDRAGAGGVWKPVWLLSSAPPAPEAENLVKNGGFERGDTDWGRSIMCGQAGLAPDPEQKHSGAAAGRLVAGAPGSAEDEARFRTRLWVRWYQQVSVRAGAVYRFRAWVRTTPDFRGTVRLWVTGTTTGTAEARLLSTAGGWRQVTLDKLVPAADLSGVYLNLMDGPGTAWFDDVELVELK